MSKERSTFVAPGAETRDHASDPIKVSFVIPCYNGREYLDECLSSIQALDLPGCEAIVVDDGSTEDIRSVVERYAPLARYLWQPNQGPAVARNLGIEHARGEFIHFLDSDDYLISPEGTRRQIAILDDHPEVGLVYAQSIKVDIQGRPFGIRKQSRGRPVTIRSGMDELSRLLFDNYITTSTTIVRRSVIQAVGGFDSQYFGPEDWDCWLRVAKVSAIAHLAEPVVAYRMHESSITARNKVDRLLRMHLSIIEGAFADPAIVERFGPSRRAIEAHMYKRAARRAYRTGQLQLAREYARKSMRIAGGRGLRHSAGCVWLYARSCVPSPAHTRLRRLSRRGKAAILSLRLADRRLQSS